MDATRKPSKEICSMKWPENEPFEVPNEWVSFEVLTAYNSLYNIENTLRLLVYIALKTAFGSLWTNTHLPSDGDTRSINQISKQRLEKARQLSYITSYPNCPLAFLTAGELTQLITADAYWKHFRRWFTMKLPAAVHKLEEIVAIRNALAHFRPVSDRDLAVLHNNAEQLFGKIEPLLADLVHPTRDVPPNIEETWHRRLQSCSTNSIQVKPKLSLNGHFIILFIEVDLPIRYRRVEPMTLPAHVKHVIGDDPQGYAETFSILTDQILNEHSHLRAHTLSVTEDRPTALTLTIESSTEPEIEADENDSDAIGDVDQFESEEDNRSGNSNSRLELLKWESEGETSSSYSFEFRIRLLKSAATKHVDELATDLRQLLENMQRELDQIKNDWQFEPSLFVRQFAPCSIMENDRDGLHATPSSVASCSHNSWSWLSVDPSSWNESQAFSAAISELTERKDRSSDIDRRVRIRKSLEFLKQRVEFIGEQATEFKRLKDPEVGRLQSVTLDFPAELYRCKVATSSPPEYWGENLERCEMSNFFCSNATWYPWLSVEE
jgi:hypothetical protein